MANLGSSDTDIILGSSDAESYNTVPQIRARATGGAGTGTGEPPGADPYTFDEGVLTGYSGLVRFGEGRYVTSGLHVDQNEDYEADATYFVGDGVRATEIEHEDGTSPTIKFSTDGSSGNFGGAKNMTVYGAGQGTGSANIIENADGNIIDQIFENLIVRYGGGDVLHLGGVSGARVRNCWLENSPGWSLYLDNGSRAKISNIHTNADKGVHVGTSRTAVTGVSVFTTASSSGLVSAGGRNTLTNLYLADTSSFGLELTGNNQVVSNAVIWNSGDIAVESTSDKLNASNIYIEDPSNMGMRLRANPAQQVSNAYIRSPGNHGVFVDGAATDSQLSNIVVDGTIGGFGARIDADNVQVTNLRVPGTPTNDPLRVDGSDVTVRAPGLTWSDVTDNGTRTVLNGVGLNAGDPSSTGDWNGNGYEGVTVRDTTNANTYLFNNGSWSQIASA